MYGKRLPSVKYNQYGAGLISNLERANCDAWMYCNLTIGRQNEHDQHNDVVIYFAPQTGYSAPVYSWKADASATATSDRAGSPVKGIADKAGNPVKQISDIVDSVKKIF